MKRVLEIDGGDGYTTIWMYLTSLNYTLKMLKNDKFYVYVIITKKLKKN